MPPTTKMAVRMVANVVIASVPRPHLDGCRPLRGQDWVVALATMDSANAAVAALPAKYRGRRRPRQWFAAERNVLRVSTRTMTRARSQIGNQLPIWNFGGMDASMCPFTEGVRGVALAEPLQRPIRTI